MTTDKKEEKTVKGIVRILATDIEGSVSLERGLRKIKGIGFRFSKAICISSGLNPDVKIGTLSEDELKTVENIIKNPKLPNWMLNRRKDPETFENTHLLGTAKLDLRTREDINKMRRIKCYKGVRHSAGQPVRGQRTRSTFRTAKTVGVVRKKIIEKSKPKTDKK